ncbi:Fasciclin-1 [Trachymyrmex cornetzi]|uniref:Fasciclin-1 n=1 Tax=Trachymyrmex cornetzi TaxID=471704 RepID=A0A151J8G4_9HYME|nr:Fasciclin-1 [Trachymyrmex cornetzi]
MLFGVTYVLHDRVSLFTPSQSSGRNKNPKIVLAVVQYLAILPYYSSINRKSGSVTAVPRSCRPRPLGFYQLLEASQVANTTLTYRHVTVFAPTNRAFQKYNGSTKNLVLYHMCE